MKSYRIVLLMLLAVSMLFLGGCKKNQADEGTVGEPVAEAKKEDPNNPQLSESEIQSIITDLNFPELTSDLSKLRRQSSINQKLEAHKTASKHFIANIFYGHSDKKMNLIPEQVLPEDYDPTTRIWYTKTLESPNGMYISEIYEDYFSKQYILTIAAPVTKEGEIVGVVGIDVIVGTNGVGTPASN